MEDIEIYRTQLSVLQRENEELKKRCGYLTDFVENGSLPLRWVDGQGLITWANNAELDLLGYSSEEYIGKKMSDLHAEIHVFEDIIQKLRDNQQILNYPAKLIHKDGSIRHVLINSSVYRENGQFIHTRCFTRDITDKVLQRNHNQSYNLKLQESEARLRLAINSTDLGTWDWNRKQKIIYWSRECRNILGLSPRDRLSFKEFLDCIHPEDRPDIDQRIQDLVNSSEDGHFDMTFRIYRINNHECRWLRAQGTVFIDADNTLNRFLGTMLDVTKSKESQEQHARLAAIVESSDDAIVSKTLEGIVTTWNDSAERLFGYSAKEIIGKSILQIIPADRKTEEEDILLQLRQGESVKHFETVRVNKSGEFIDVSLTISPLLDSDGHIIGISKIARDITERKEGDKRKNDFISLVSHELKTPLTSILLYTQLLDKKIVQAQYEELSQLSRRVELHAKRMNNLLADYLNLSRIEQGKAELNLMHFDLADLIKEVVSDAELFESHHRFIIKGEQELQVYADRDKICQVLTNLISNAVKYSPAGGDILITYTIDSRQTSIRVSDQGIGISKKDQENLFQRFYRVKDQRSKNVSGFGIGLYLVAEILRLHGRQILIDSKIGKGSTFSFTLDVADT